MMAGPNGGVNQPSGGASNSGSSGPSNSGSNGANNSSSNDPSNSGSNGANNSGTNDTSRLQKNLSREEQVNMILYGRTTAPNPRPVSGMPGVICLACYYLDDF